jgi:hypothetical protein
MNIPIWNGSSSFYPGRTPFGFYDHDYQFQVDADKVANFCARRLGYPITDVELQDINFYTAFEQAVTIYGNELYAYKIRDNQLSLEGLPTNTDVNNSIISPNLNGIIKISKQYGTEAGSGGNVTYYTGSIQLEEGQQNYDLTEWAISEGVNGSLGIEIKRVFYESPPAITRYFDPYVGSGFGFQNLFDSFGFGSLSPAINFLMMPLNYDVQVLQAIELNDKIRRSDYSFEIRNNKLKIFPIPTGKRGKLFFEYIKVDERIQNSVIPSDGKVTNVSDVPYDNPSYCKINSVGRQWIFDYTLALSKEMLGLIRGKYNTIPIPKDSVTLNHNDLIASANSEKKDLIERLRAYFDETSRKSLLERKSNESDFLNKELSHVPLSIYVG